MNIVVFSDSHRSMEGMRTVIDTEKPDYIFHLGDHDCDAEALMREYPTLPLAYVRGNCDGHSNTPERRIFSLGGLRFFLCHGHTYGVKRGYLQAVYAALEEHADVLLFGHTHTPYYDCMDACNHKKLYILNPGSCGRGAPSTYGRILLSPGKIPAFGYFKI